MIDGHLLKPGDAIVYIDNTRICLFQIQSLLTINKTYIILKTNVVSSSSIGVTIKADDDVIREFNIYNGRGLCRFKRLEDIRDEKLRKLGI